MYVGLHTTSDAVRLYVDRKVGGSWLVRVEDLVKHEKRQLNCYVENIKESVMRAVVAEKVKKQGKRGNGESAGEMDSKGYDVQFADKGSARG